MISTRRIDPGSINKGKVNVPPFLRADTPEVRLEKALDKARLVQDQLFIMRVLIDRARPKMEESKVALIDECLKEMSDLLCNLLAGR